MCSTSNILKSSFVSISNMRSMDKPTALISASSFDNFPRACHRQNRLLEDPNSIYAPKPLCSVTGLPDPCTQSTIVFLPNSDVLKTSCARIMSAGGSFWEDRHVCPPSTPLILYKSEPYTDIQISVDRKENHEAFRKIPYIS